MKEESWCMAECYPSGWPYIAKCARESDHRGPHETKSGSVRWTGNGVDAEEVA
jgi:hypothetical protein